MHTELSRRVPTKRKFLRMQSGIFERLPRRSKESLKIIRDKSRQILQFFKMSPFHCFFIFLSGPRLLYKSMAPDLKIQLAKKVRQRSLTQLL
jgi:hypothetical protein